MYKHITLKNGLQCIVVPMQNTQSVTVLKAYNVGSRQETQGLFGAAHYIEHMMFKGTKKRPTAKDISKELDRVGAQFNAYTGKDMTAYYVKVAHDHFELAVDVISDITYNATFPKEETEREKGVIIEEIKMYEDNPQRMVDNYHEQLAYQGGELGRDTIGTVKSITEMKREDLLTFRDLYYTDANAGLVIVGNVPKDFEDILNSYFTQEAKEVTQPSLVKYPTLRTASAISVQSKKVEQVHTIIGFTCEGYLSQDAYTYAVFTTILGGGMSSPLFDEIRDQRGLCYYIYMYPDLYDNVGSLVIRAGLNKDKVEEGFEAISELLRRYKENGVTDEELQDAKEQTIGAMALSLEDTAKHAESYVKRMVVGKEILSPEEKIKKIKAVTKDDIMKVLDEVITKDNVTVTVVSDFDKHENLLDTINL